MKKHQEEGRIGSWAKQRRATYEFVNDLLPALKEARRELADPLKKTTDKMIANWLNEKGYQSIRNARFHGPTIMRIVLDTGDKLRAFARREHETGTAIVKYERLPDKRERQAALDQTLAARLAEADLLDSELKKILSFVPPDGTSPSALPVQTMRAKRVKVSNGRKRLGAIWNHIRRTCDDENAVGYEDAGALGVKVDEVWREDFDQFADWSMANGYTNSRDLFRVDKTGNFAPTNCEWR